MSDFKIIREAMEWLTNETLLPAVKNDLEAMKQVSGMRLVEKALAALDRIEKQNPENVAIITYAVPEYKKDLGCTSERLARKIKVEDDGFTAAGQDCSSESSSSCLCCGKQDEPVARIIGKLGAFVCQRCYSLGN